MKTHLHFTITFCCAMLLMCSASVFAQSTLQDKESADEIYFIAPDGGIVSSGSGSGLNTPKPKKAVKKDSSLTIQPPPAVPLGKTPPALKPAVEKRSKVEDEESILSFNFLYYLIQKYKMEDIMN